MASFNDVSNLAPLGPSPATAPATNASPCPRCGGAMDAASATFDDEGTLVCATCAEAGDIDRAEQRAAMAILGPAVGSTVTALVSFLINPFAIVSILAIASSIGALLTLVRHPEYKERMGWRVPATWIFACLGIVLALTPRLLVLAAIAMLLA